MSSWSLKYRGVESSFGRNRNRLDILLSAGLSWRLLDKFRQILQRAPGVSAW